MMSTSGGLKPRAVAGSPSVTRFTQRSWTGMRASGIPRAAVRKMLQGMHGGGVSAICGGGVSAICGGGVSAICGGGVSAICGGGVSAIQTTQNYRQERHKWNMAEIRAQQPHEWQ